MKINTGAAVLGLGYIVGLKYAAIICAGSLVVWLVIVPGMALLFGDQVLNAWNPALTQTISEMSPEVIFKEYAKKYRYWWYRHGRCDRYRALMGHYKECCGTGRQRDGRQEGGSKRHPHAERPFHENNRLRVHLHHPADLTVLLFLM